MEPESFECLHNGLIDKSFSKRNLPIFFFLKREGRGAKENKQTKSKYEAFARGSYTIKEESPQTLGTNGVVIIKEDNKIEHRIE